MNPELKTYFDSLGTKYTLTFFKAPDPKESFYSMFAPNSIRAATFREADTEEAGKIAIRQAIELLNEDLTNKPEVLE